MCHSLTMEYYSALQRKKILSHTKKWMNLQDITLSERRPSHTHKDKYCMILPIWASLMAQLVKNPPAKQETLVQFLPPGLGRPPGEGKGHPLQYSWASLWLNS